MKLHVAVAAWMLGAEKSGARSRMFGLLHAIADQLSSGEEITVLYRRGQEIDELPAGISCHPIDIPAAPTWRRVLAERRLLAKSLKSMAVNLVELGTLPVPAGLPCPSSLTIHDLRDLEGWRRRPAALVRMILSRSLRRVACVTVPSEFTAGTLLEAIGNQAPPIQVVPGAADESFHHLQPKAASGRSYFLHVGHLEARKNLMFLLSSYAALLSEYPSAEDCPALFLVGRDQGEAPALKERAAMLDLSAHVHFFEQVGKQELERLYLESSGLLIPSLHEGFGLTAIEGLAVGIPVLASNRGALPEVLGDAGEVLEADDPRAWAKAMAAAALNPRDPRDVAKRKQRASEFSWAQSAELVLDAWRRHARHLSHQ
ncbi:MAG: glycosyltransferase [Planctomycetota bacterium]|jgi:glycosyltransferase involved in cell wall biosynthesis